MAVKDPRTKDPNAPFSKSGGEIYKDEKPSPFSIEALRSGATSSKIVKGFLVLSGLIMAGGFMATSLHPPGAQGGASGGGAPVNPTTAVATVGDQTIQNGQLQRALEQSLQFKQYTGQQATVASYFDDKKTALKQLTDNAANVEAARAAGIVPTDAEIDKKIDEFVSEQLKPQGGQSEVAFRRQIETQFGSLAKAKEEIRKGYDRNLVANQVAVEKLEKQIKDSNKTTEADFKAANTKLKLWQIVIRPETPKPGAKDATAQADKAKLDAQTEAAKVFAQLKAKPTLANFKTTAQKVSDDEATKKSGGDFGLKLPTEVYGDPTWPDLLAKSSGNLVGPLKDQSGAQTIFFIESRKLELPKDFAKNKKKLLADFETQKDNEAWTKKQEDYKKAVTPQISDPSLAAYEQITDPDFYSKTVEEQKKIREDAVSRLQTALASANENEAAAIHFQLANLYGFLGKKPEQLKSLAEAVKLAPRDTDLRLQYARALRDGGQPKVALAQLKEASKNLSDNPPAPSMFGGGSDPSAPMRQQIAAEFDLLKEKKLADAERAKIKAAPAGAPGGMGGMGGLPPGIQLR